MSRLPCGTEASVGRPVVVQVVSAWTFLSTRMPPSLLLAAHPANAPRPTASPAITTAGETAAGKAKQPGPRAMSPPRKIVSSRRFTAQNSSNLGDRDLRRLTRAHLADHDEAEICTD